MIHVFISHAVPTLPTEGKPQMPFPWPNNLQHYMNNFQGPVFPQVSPYPQGYLFPGMQVPSSYYPKWPPNVDSDAQSHKSFSKSKKKHSHKKFSKTLQEEEEEEQEEEEESSTEESDSSRSNRGMQNGKKHGKRSSRKVVIRNINYIASERDGKERSGSSEGSSTDEEDFKHQVEKAVESLHNRRKSSSSSHHQKKREIKHERVKGEMSFDAAGDDSGNRHANNSEGGIKGNPWDAFQSLLMRDEEPARSQEESFILAKSEQGSLSARGLKSGIMKPQAVSDDSFIIRGDDIGPVVSTGPEEFASSQNHHPIMKKRESNLEDSLIMNRVEDSGTSFSPSDFAAVASSTVKVQREGDWFIGDQANEFANCGRSFDYKPVLDDSAFGEGVSQVDVKRKERDNLPVDDSFIIEGRRMSDGLDSDSRLLADISIVTDIVETKNTHNESHDGKMEPEDLYMMLHRNTDVEPAGATWTPEMIYENNVSLDEVSRRQSHVEHVDGNENKSPSKGATSSKEAKSKPVTGSLRRSNPETTLRTRRLTSGSRAAAPKSKAEKVYRVIILLLLPCFY